MDEAVSVMNLEDVRSLCKSLKENGVTADVMKMAADNSLHKKAFEIALTDESVQEGLLRKFLDFTFQVAKEDMCSRSATVAIVQDVFDVIPIDRCERFFSIVESHLSEWKTTHFFESCRNMVLRMCNDLLKRLSRTVNTTFCGQILVLLARALPLCEKSGLNLVSQFNADNITKYETEESFQDNDLANGDSEDMETGEIKESRDIPVDYALYAKFWQLQSFFSSPTVCYEKSKWRVFQHNTTEVLDMLLSHKLEQPSEEADDDCIIPRKKDRKEESADVMNSSVASTSNMNSTIDSEEGCSSECDTFVAKYLTSQKLLQLQLNDSQFRRYFLVQCLILYQYLLADVKFKDKSYALNDEQIRFVIESTDKCYQLLRETHPRGSYFAECVKKILEREKEWSEWKNKGCFDYTTLADKEKMSVFKRRPKVRYDASKVDLGNAELTKLWNINPDMLSACEDKNRKFCPPMADFIRDPLDELDPEQQVEDQYKSVNNEAFQWRASRLLMYHSSAYFQLPSKRNEVISAIGPFLEEVIKQTAASLPEFASTENGLLTKLQPNETRSDSTNGHSDSPQFVQNGKEQESSPRISNLLIKELAPLLAKEWSLLAGALNVNMSEFSDLEAEEAVKSVLNHWKKTDGTSATVKKLGSVLLNAGIFTEQIGVILKKVSSKEVAVS